MSIKRLTHLGICVSDLEQSRRFYCDVLGCREVGRLELEGRDLEKLNQMEGMKARVSYIERDGWRLELMEFPSPGTTGRKGPRPMNEVGLTHLSFRVDDLDAACTAIEAGGGSVLRDTLVEVPGPTKVIMVLDPDGQRLELIEAPGDLNALPLGADQNMP